VQTKYRLAHDPVFYIMVGFFALITTALPTVLSQPRFLPLAQTLCLFVMLAIPVRQRLARQAMITLSIWLVVQLMTMSLITWFAPSQVEGAIGDGFIYRRAYLEWFFATGPAPDSFFVQPFNRVVELIGVLVGSLISGGLIGVWFLTRATNLAGFGVGSLLIPLQGATSLVAALPIWTLVRLAGYGGLIALLAEPLLTGHWALGYYWQERRPLLLWAVGLVALGLLLEAILPSFWRTLFQPVF